MKETVYHRFLFSIVRHLLTMLTGIFVSWGWVDVDTANEFNSSAAMKVTLALMTFGGALYWSYKDKIWEFVKTRVALMLPPNTGIEDVAKIAITVQDKKAVANGEIEEIVLPTGGKLTTRIGGGR